MHREALLKVKRNRKINNVDISRKTGISENHLSQFFRGNRNATDQVLDQVVEAMEELSPGAKADYAKEIAGSYDEIFYEHLDEDELAEQMIRLGRAWKRLRSSHLQKALASG
jgi:transcriptional regulator with XRE-family HTH domain